MLNFGPEFIDQAWDHFPIMRDHLKGKWLLHTKKAAEEQGYVDANSFVNWFVNLDNSNREILLDWVTKNHVSFAEFKLYEKLECLEPSCEEYGNVRYIKNDLVANTDMEIDVKCHKCSSYLRFVDPPQGIAL